MDKVMDVMRLMAEKLGTTVETLAPHYVQYVWACGLVGVIIGVFLLCIMAPASAYLVAWGLRGLVDRKIVNEEPRMVAIGIGVLLGLGSVIGGVVAIGFSLPAMLAPEGYAVAQLLRAAL